MMFKGDQWCSRMFKGIQRLLLKKDLLVEATITDIEEYDSSDDAATPDSSHNTAHALLLSSDH